MANESFQIAETFVGLDAFQVQIAWSDTFTANDRILMAIMAGWFGEQVVAGDQLSLSVSQAFDDAFSVSAEVVSMDYGFIADTGTAADSVFIIWLLTDTFTAADSLPNSPLSNITDTFTATMSINTLTSWWSDRAGSSDVLSSVGRTLLDPFTATDIVIPGYQLLDAGHFGDTFGPVGQSWVDFCAALDVIPYRVAQFLDSSSSSDLMIPSPRTSSGDSASGVDSFTLTVAIPALPDMATVSDSFTLTLVYWPLTDAAVGNDSLQLTVLFSDSFAGADSIPTRDAEILDGFGFGDGVVNRSIMFVDGATGADTIPNRVI